jgi:hypothetical protein
MASDFSIKPISASVAPLPGPAPAAAKAAVPTQLPADKAVTAPDTSVAIRNNAQAGNGPVSRQVIIDHASAELVQRVVDSRTNVVIRQFPDETRLKLRAYARAENVAKEQKSAAREEEQRLADQTA